MDEFPLALRQRFSADEPEIREYSYMRTIK